MEQIEKTSTVFKEEQKNKRKLVKYNIYVKITAHLIGISLLIVVIYYPSCKLL